MVFHACCDTLFKKNCLREGDNMMSWKKMSMILFCFSNIQGMETQPSSLEALDVDSNGDERDSSTYQVIVMDSHVLMPPIIQILRLSRDGHTVEDVTSDNTTFQRLSNASRQSDTCTTRQTMLCCGGIILLVIAGGILNWLHTVS